MEESDILEIFFFDTRSLVITKSTDLMSCNWFSWRPVNLPVSLKNRGILMIPDKKNVAFSDQGKEKKTHPTLLFKKSRWHFSFPLRSPST